MDKMGSPEREDLVGQWVCPDLPVLLGHKATEGLRASRDSKGRLDLRANKEKRDRQVNQAGMGMMGNQDFRELQE